MKTKATRKKLSANQKTVFYAIISIAARNKKCQKMQKIGTWIVYPGGYNE